MNYNRKKLRLERKLQLSRDVVNDVTDKKILPDWLPSFHKTARTFHPNTRDPPTPLYNDLS